MTFQIDTGQRHSPNFYEEVKRDEGFAMDMSDWTRADRFKRQTIEAIWSSGDAADLDIITAQKDIELEALFLSHPDMWDEIEEALDECRAGFRASSGPAEPGNSLGIKF